MFLALKDYMEDVTVTYIRLGRLRNFFYYAHFEIHRFILLQGVLLESLKNLATPNFKVNGYDSIYEN